MAKPLHITTAKPCISSRRSLVSHQVAEEYTFGDDIRLAAMIYTLKRDDIRLAAMIYQVCDLDKKIRILANADFLVDPRGIEPLSENPFSKLSTSVFGPIISLPVAGPTKIGGGSSFIRGGYKSNSPLTFTAH